VIYCINPKCSSRQNDDYASTCPSCGASLLIYQRFLLQRPLFDLDRISPHDIFEAIDTTGSTLFSANSLKILKVLKVSDDLHVRLFQREAKILKSITHPGIPMIDIEDDFILNINGMDLRCIALPKIDGITLEKWVSQNGRLTQDQGILWLKQIVEILGVVHQEGYFHRDIKPSNIIVQPSGNLSLIDFGSARQVTDTFLAKIGTGQSLDLTQVGTLGYSAPEQMFGVSVPQSDFYALGFTMIYALTGKHLYELPRDVKTQQLQWEKAMPHVAKPVKQFLKDLIASSVALRPKNTQEILDSLNQSLPRKILWTQRWKSKPVRLSAIFLVAIAIIGLLHFCRLGLSQYYYDIGTNQANNAEYASARQSLHLSNWLNANEPAYRALALICVHVGDMDCAKDNYEAATKINPSNDSPWYNLATYYEDQKKYKEARNTYAIALARRKDDSSILNNIARLDIKEGKYIDAQVTLDKAKDALKGRQDNESLQHWATIHKNQGWLLFKKKDYTNAKKNLIQSINENPNLVSSYCLIAQVNEALKQFANDKWEKCTFPSKNKISNPQGETLPEVYEWRHLRFNRGSQGI
jgi:serine/threonine protein kinase